MGALLFMPYLGPDDPSLPERIKKLSKEKRNHWQGAWNGAFKQYGDEGRAFAVANAAIKEADTNYYLEEQEDIAEAELTRKAINDLPDSDFAYIEPGGADEDGKTKPRALRHFPIHDDAHVRNALARAPQSPFGEKAMPKITAAAKRLKIGEVAEQQEAVEFQGKQLMGLTESIVDLEEASGEVWVTLIRPGWSPNIPEGNKYPTYYSRDILANAAPLYEGVSAYLNHPTAVDLKQRNGNRDIRDYAGHYEDVQTASDGSLRARLVLEGANGEFLKPLIEGATKQKVLRIGLSHHVEAETGQGSIEGKPATLVKRIIKVRSADIVTNPAAGGAFDRLVASIDWIPEILKEVSFEQWQEHHPEWQEKRQEGFMSDKDNERMVALEEQVKSVSAQLEIANRRELARGKLAASKLPVSVHADLLESLATMDAGAQDKELERTEALLGKLNIRPLVTGVGQGASNGATATELKEQAPLKVLGAEGIKVPKPDEDIWAFRDRIRANKQGE